MLAGWFPTTVGQIAPGRDLPISVSSPGDSAVGLQSGRQSDISSRPVYLADASTPGMVFFFGIQPKPTQLLVYNQITELSGRKASGPLCKAVEKLFWRGEGGGGGACG